MEKMDKQELISALADGQLQGEALGLAVGAAATDPKGLAAWHAYHLIGDVLRSGELAVQGAGVEPSAFLARFQLRLEQETIPAREAVRLLETAATYAGVRAGAANDANFRWKIAAGVASLAAVAAIGWTAVAGSFVRPEQVQLASTLQPGPALAVGERPVMLRDSRLDELLAAHRQFGGTTALQMPAGYLHNATFEGPAR